jgi:methylated-DNA-[protein]-cysteine S-methyltransferase
MDYCASFHSPLGMLELASNGTSITRVSFTDHRSASKQSCPVLDNCIRELNAYFSGKQTSFSVPLAPEGTPFQQSVWRELLAIPYGTVITYQDLAIRMNNPKLVRAVATANGRNPIAILIPCHRVIGSGNKLTGYAGGIWRKQWLLEHELNFNPRKTTLF